MRPQYITLTATLGKRRFVGEYSLTMFEAVADVYDEMFKIFGERHQYQLVI